MYNQVFLIEQDEEIPEQTPEDEIAPSEGGLVNVNVPPVLPIIVAVPPVQVGEVVKLGFSEGITVIKTSSKAVQPVADTVVTTVYVEIIELEVKFVKVNEGFEIAVLLSPVIEFHK